MAALSGSKTAGPFRYWPHAGVTGDLLDPAHRSGVPIRLRGDSKPESPDRLIKVTPLSAASQQPRTILPSETIGQGSDQS
jgi:hypothetical protein